MGKVNIVKRRIKMCIDIKSLKNEWEKAKKSMDCYHIHIYFDRSDNSNISSVYDASNIEMYLSLMFPEYIIERSNVGIIGPHTKESFLIEVKKEGFGEVVKWLQMNTKDNSSILIHPETDNVFKDHIDRSLWVGKPTKFNNKFLNSVKKPHISK